MDFIKVTRANSSAESCVEGMMLIHYNIILVACLRELLRPILDFVLLQRCRIVCKLSTYYKSC